MQFEIVDDSTVMASIDVFEVPTASAGEVCRLGLQLLDAAKAEAPDFIAGAVHFSLPPLQQPLIWLGAVPLTRRFVALYAQWRADGARLGFAGFPAGAKLREQMARFSAGAETIISDPAANLYVPTLIDATGELCPDKSECKAGIGVGPLIDDAKPNPRAQFINIFRTTPDRQQHLLEATYAIMPIARLHDGYLRTALHRSLDGTKVANYGQYERVDQIRSMYFHGRTAKAFGSILFKDVTAPATLFGKRLTIGGHAIGSTPRLRCYTVDRVEKGDRAEHGA